MMYSVVDGRHLSRTRLRPRTSGALELQGRGIPLASLLPLGLYP